MQAKQAGQAVWTHQAAAHIRLTVKQQAIGARDRTFSCQLGFSAAVKASGKWKRMAVAGLTYAKGAACC